MLALLVQLALEPLWKLYEVCIAGTDADVKAVMGKAVKSLNLTQVILNLTLASTLLA